MAGCRIKFAWDKLFTNVERRKGTIRQRPVTTTHWAGGKGGFRVIIEAVSNYPASLAGAPPTAERSKSSIKIPYSCVLWLSLLGAAGIPLTLLWDFSWESTIGIDRLWTPAHTAGYLAVILAGLIALWVIAKTSRG